MAGRAKVRQYPRQMVAKMSMEMNTIWLKMMPYLQQQYETHERGGWLSTCCTAPDAMHQ